VHIGSQLAEERSEKRGAPAAVFGKLGTRGNRLEGHKLSQTRDHHVFITLCRRLLTRGRVFDHPDGYIVVVCARYEELTSFVIGDGRCENLAFVGFELSEELVFLADVLGGVGLKLSIVNRAVFLPRTLDDAT
jgi:hypothetical protein